MKVAEVAKYMAIIAVTIIGATKQVIMLMLYLLGTAIMSIIQVRPIESAFR